MMRLARLSNFKSYGGSQHRCHWKFKAGYAEIVLQIRNTEVSHDLSREEMYDLLRLLRQNEVRQGWKTPEPSMDPPTLASDVLEMRLLGLMVLFDNAKLNTLAQFAESLYEGEI